MGEIVEHIESIDNDFLYRIQDLIVGFGRNRDPDIRGLTESIMRFVKSAVNHTGLGLEDFRIIFGGFVQYNDDEVYFLDPIRPVSVEQYEIYEEVSGMVDHEMLWNRKSSRKIGGKYYSAYDRDPGILGIFNDTGDSSIIVCDDGVVGKMRFKTGNVMYNSSILIFHHGQIPKISAVSERRTLDFSITRNQKGLRRSFARGAEGGLDVIRELIRETIEENNTIKDESISDIALKHIDRIESASEVSIPEFLQQFLSRDTLGYSRKSAWLRIVKKIPSDIKGIRVYRENIIYDPTEAAARSFLPDTAERMASGTVDTLMSFLDHYSLSILKSVNYLSTSIDYITDSFPGNSIRGIVVLNLYHSDKFVVGSIKDVIQSDADDVTPRSRIARITFVSRKL